MQEDNHGLLDWINFNKLDWYSLASNPNAIHLIREALETPNPKPNRTINWYNLCTNPNAIDIIEANPDKIYWHFLALNPNPKVIDLFHLKPDIYLSWIENNLNHLDLDLLLKHPKIMLMLKDDSCNFIWDRLSANPNAIHLLESNPEKINWNWLSTNPNDVAIQWLGENPEKINWFSILKNANPNVKHLWNANLDKINDIVCLNKLSSNPNSISFLEENPDKMCWKGLSKNPNAIHLLEANPDKIDWVNLSLNPAIFKSYHEGINEYVLK